LILVALGSDGCPVTAIREEYSLILGIFNSGGTTLLRPVEDVAFLFLWGVAPYPTSLLKKAGKSTFA
jgi:hypothetical protein